VVQHRVPRTFENPNAFIGPTADNSAAALRPSYREAVGEGERRVLAQFHTGPATDTGRQTHIGRRPESSSVAWSKREPSVEVPISNATSVSTANPLCFDYGRSSANPHPNHSRRGVFEDLYVGNARATATPTTDGSTDPSTSTLLPPRLSKKELTVHFADDARNMRGDLPEKAEMYDPNEVARTTIKETLLHDTWTAGVLAPDQGHARARQPEEQNVRATVRQTMPNSTNDTNLRVAALAGSVHDPHDVTKTTVKETTLERKWKGQVSSRQSGDAYLVTDVAAHPTLRQQTSDVSHFGGGPAREDATGYLVSPAEARETQKHGLSDNHYFGTAGTVSAKASMSYQDIYEATLSEVRQDTLRRRGPTPEGPKVVSGCDGIAMDIKVQELPVHRASVQALRVINTPNQTPSAQMTSCPASLQPGFRPNPVALRPTDPGRVLVASPQCITDPCVIKQRLEHGQLPRYF